MLAFSIDYYGIFFGATQSVELFCTYDYKDYTQEELEDILEKFQIVHSRYPLGVCVRKDIHLLYHSIYSKCVNTEDQWNQFVVDFKNGVYDDQIKIA